MNWEGSSHLQWRPELEFTVPLAPTVHAQEAPSS